MLVIMTVAATSCKSDEENDDPTAGGSTWVLVQIGDTKYEYDKSGRIIKEIEYDGHVITVTYGDGTITYFDEDETDPSDNIKVVFKTNENGLITSGYYNSCEYDANGFLVKTFKKYSDSSFTETYTWSEGLLTDYYKNYGGSEIYKKIEYDYDSPMNADCARFINQFYLSIGYDGIVTQGGGFGKVPSVPMKSISSMFGADYTHNWYTTTRTFSDYDENGCPGTMTTQNDDTGKTYTQKLVWAKR